MTITDQSPAEEPESEGVSSPYQNGEEDKESVDEFYGLNSKAVEDFRRVLDQHSQGIPLTKFEEEYRTMTKLPMICHEWGYRSIKELIYIQKNIFTVEQANYDKNCAQFGDYANDDIVHDARKKLDFGPSTKTSVKTRGAIAAKKSQSTIPKQARARFFKLIYQRQQPVAIEDIVNQYLECKYSFEDDYCPVKSGRQFAKELSEKVPIKVLNGNRVVAKSQDKVDDWIKKLQDNQTVDSLKVLVNPMPSNVVFTFKPLIVDLDMLVNDFRHQLVKTVITVCTKKHLKIILYVNKEPQHYPNFDYLFYDMNQFYNSNVNEQLIVPEIFVCPDFICVAKEVAGGVTYWNRAQIIKVKGNNEVEVRLYDHGFKQTLHREDLRLLVRQFFETPFAAIKLKLSQIEPTVGNLWSDEAQERLLTFSSSERRLALSIVGKSGDNSLTGFLFDFSTDEPVLVNKLLVDEELAQWTPPQTVSDVRQFRTLIERYLNPTAESDARQTNGQPKVKSYAIGDFLTFAKISPFLHDKATTPTTENTDTHQTRSSLSSPNDNSSA